MNSSNWTGRTARTMRDAFGPYTAEQIDDDGPQWHDDPLNLLIAAMAAFLGCWAVVSALFVWSAQ